MIEVAEDMEAVLDRVRTILPNDFPVRVWTAVRDGTECHAGQFLRETQALT